MSQNPSTPPPRTIIGLRPEPYQVRVIEAVGRAIRARKSGAVLAATASGKTLMAVGIVEDAFASGVPVLVVQPSNELLLQNVRSMRLSPMLRDVPIGLVSTLTRGVRSALGPLAPGEDFDQAVTFATNAKLTRKYGSDSAAIDRFCAAGGVVIVDEGERGAAQAIGHVLSLFASRGAVGIALSATPFRTDREDPLSPWGTDRRRLPHRCGGIPGGPGHRPHRPDDVQARASRVRRGRGYGDVRGLEGCLQGVRRRPGDLRGRCRG